MLKPVLLTCFAFATSPALAQTIAPLPLRPVPLQLLPVAEVRLPRELTSVTLYCGVSGVTVTSPELFYPYTTIQPILSRVAGVQVTPNSGAPGDWATVRIRGSGLRGADQPLYVIDGLPALNADFAPVQSAPQPVYGWADGPQVSAAGANPLLFVVPQDIEYITVLKGASATAEYGSQGGNGVILITTRHGGKKDAVRAPRLRYENSTGVQQVRQRLSLLDAHQYADLANDVWRSAGSVGPPPFSTAALASLGPGTDWQRELFGAALLQNHWLSFDGSTARLRYAASANYLGQDGVVLNSQLRRYGLRLNLDCALSLTWRVQLNVAVAAVTRTLPPANTVPTALLAPPTVAAYTGGVPTLTSGPQAIGPGYASSFFNPVVLAQQATTDDTRRLLVQASTIYQARPALRLEAQLSHEQATVEATNRRLTNGGSSNDPPVAGDYVRTTQHLATTNARLALAYEPLRTGRHQLTTQANVQVQHLGRRQEQLVLQAFPGASSVDYPFTLLSASASATYTFAEQLKLTAVARADHGAAAQYALGTNGWQLYPGTEVIWELDKLAFIQNLQAISSLQINAALSQCNNVSSTAAGFPAGPTSTPVTTQISPNDTPLTPRTTQFNAGLTVRLFGNKLAVAPTFYSHYTRHANVAQALFTPISTLLITRDVDVRNQGLELAVSSYWHLGHRFEANSFLSASYNQQTVVSVADLATIGPVPGLNEGEPLHPFYGYQRLGIGATGSVQYRDTNGSGSVTPADAGYFGTGIPPYLLDFSQTLTYDRFTLQVQLDGLFGYQLLSPALAVLDQPTATTNGSTQLLDRWTPTHPSADVPQASYTRPLFYDDHTPQSANNFRLSLLTVSCRLLKPESLHQLHVWVGGQNLFVLTSYRGFDPSVSSGGGMGQLAGYDASQYPVARTWLAGLRASF
ncbi:MAG: TonB-dependent receptor plug domain-containing protein [Janthinobacterium lividum]